MYRTSCNPCASLTSSAVCIHFLRARTARLLVIWLCVFVSVLPTSVSRAEELSPTPNPSAEASREIASWIVFLAENYMPREYNNEKKWGIQKTVFDGWELRREGVKLETKRRWKDVNHGTWTKYFLTVREPHTHFQINLSDLKTLPDGRMRFHAKVRAPLDLDGRLSLWQYDVQMISLHADAEADVEVDLDCEVSIKLHPLTFPPDVLIQPVVVNSDLKLTYFRLLRLSQVGGPMAKHLGEGMEFFIQKFVEDKNENLTEKLNQAIEKKKDRLRISGSEWLQSHMQELFKSPKAE
ncbi:MAG: hypothetical protein RLY14_245 [Planctomycetota bacterium]